MSLQDAWDGFERRTSDDRRGAERQGKYDRRQNRCQSCAHFQYTGAQAEGWCLKHTRVFHPQAFACPLFEASP